METLKRKRGRPRKEQTNNVVVISNTTKENQKDLEKQIIELKEIINEHETNFTKEKEVFKGRVEKIYNVMEKKYNEVIDHYRGQLNNLTQKVVKERTSKIREGMILIKGHHWRKFIIVTKCSYATNWNQLRGDIQTITTSGIGSRKDVLWSDSDYGLDVLCHISTYKDHCLTHGLKPRLNKQTCVKLYEKMYGKKWDEGEFDYNLMETYGLLSN